MGGRDLKATGRCIYATQVTQTPTFDAYWSDPAFLDKKPVRNGSRRTMVGDNIYSRSRWTGQWEQADSHHSRPDGSPDVHNMTHDTSVDRVLVSRQFVYFGRNAPDIPAALLEKIGYRNVRDYRVIGDRACQPLLDWVTAEWRRNPNRILGNPFQFRISHARYSSRLDRVLA